MSSFLPFFNNDTTRSDQQEESCFPSLSFKERLIGFAVCFALGIFIEVISFGSFIMVAAGKPAKFAICYSFGNILTLLGTGFLVGFKKQWQNMIDKTRLYTSLVFLGALIMTLVSALVIKSGWLVLLFLIIQVCAYIWYVASYIPFARDCMRSCLSKFVSPSS